MNGPVIQGTRCRLRPLVAADLPVVLEWFADLDVTSRLKVRYPLSLTAEEEWLRNRSGDPDWIVWGIEHGGSLVGVTSIGPISWAQQRGTTGTVIGEKAAWGKGIGTEVMRRRAEFAFTETTLRKLVSGYIEGNEASRRAQLTAGYQEVGRQRQHFYREGRWLDHIITELLREDWEAARPPAS